MGYELSLIHQRILRSADREYFGSAPGALRFVWMGASPERSDFFTQPYQHVDRTMRCSTVVVL